MWSVHVCGDFTTKETTLKSNPTGFPIGPRLEGVEEVYISRSNNNTYQSDEQRTGQTMQLFKYFLGMSI